MVPPLFSTVSRAVPSVRLKRLRCIGRPRLPLLSCSGKPLKEVFGHIFLLPCTKRQLSERIFMLTSSYHSVKNYKYPSKKSLFCQAKQNPSFQWAQDPCSSISSALLNVVSVIVVPPIIRASSRFLPSRSRGSTEV